jgi:hypothetical protein
MLLARDPNRIPLLRDPEDPNDDFVYTVARKPDGVIDGTPVHTYEIMVTPQQGAGTYGAKITIALPNC